jgi:hypothetical protein
MFAIITFTQHELSNVIFETVSYYMIKNVNIHLKHGNPIRNVYHSKGSTQKKSQLVHQNQITLTTSNNFTCSCIYPIMTRLRVFPLMVSSD